MILPKCDTWLNKIQLKIRQYKQSKILAWLSTINTSLKEMKVNQSSTLFCIKNSTIW